MFIICLFFGMFTNAFCAQISVSSPFEYTGYCRREMAKGRNPRIYDKGKMITCSLYVQKEFIEKVAKEAAAKGREAYRKSTQQTDRKIGNGLEFPKKTPQSEKIEHRLDTQKKDWKQGDEDRGFSNSSRQGQPDRDRQRPEPEIDPKPSENSDLPSFIVLVSGRRLQMKRNLEIQFLHLNRYGNRRKDKICSVSEYGLGSA